VSGTKPYPQKLRERAVWMVAEMRPNYESDWAAITAVAARLGIGTAETMRKWVRQAQVDAGRRPGTSTDESAELKRLQRENARVLAPGSFARALTSTPRADPNETLGSRQMTSRSHSDPR
jgi:transposase